MNLFTDIYESPVGPLQMISDDRNLCLLKYFRNNKTEEYISSKISGFNIINKSNQVIRDTSKQLNEYFSNKRKKFDISLSFLYGTAFQIKVWKNLSSIKYGETVSYMDVANLIDNPKSYRAVGNANNKNPISIIIPCHRVIASDGTLGGYGGGLNSKKILLEIELS
jgi:O-6-methylguanine DNA methyltransferase